MKAGETRFFGFLHGKHGEFAAIARDRARPLQRNTENSFLAGPQRNMRKTEILEDFFLTAGIDCAEIKKS
jgi:hypothetical protein